MAKLVPLHFGPLPVAKINQALGLDLDNADVRMTVAAQRHAAKRHPQDYPVYLPFIGDIIANALYARDDFRNDGKVELIGKPVGSPHWLLVAVAIFVDADGHYNVASFYPLSQKKVDERRQSGHLKILI